MITALFQGDPTLNESPSEKEGKFESSPASPVAAGVPSMKVPPKRKGNPPLIERTHRKCALPSMKVPPKRKGNLRGCVELALCSHPSMKVPPKRKGNISSSPSFLLLVPPSMKVPPKRKGNSYPKIARNHAAETGASREPRGGYTQNYTLQPHLPPHNSLAREETMRATRHVPVTYQVLAHTKTPAGCFLSDPARVLTYERGWRGSGKPD